MGIVVCWGGSLLCVCETGQSYSSHSGIKVRPDFFFHPHTKKQGILGFFCQLPVQHRKWTGILQEPLCDRVSDTRQQ